MGPIALSEAAHLSCLRCSLPPMQAAMMTAEAMPSSLPEKSIDSVGVVPLSWSMGRGWPSTLRQGNQTVRAVVGIAGAITSRHDISAAAHLRV